MPIDNSRTGRKFQNVAKLRLDMLFAGSTEGAHRACVLLEVIATCRALRVPAQAYLAWVFERLGPTATFSPSRSKRSPPPPPHSRERSTSQARFPGQRFPASLVAHLRTDG